MIEVYRARPIDGGCMSCMNPLHPILVIRLSMEFGAMTWETRVCSNCWSELISKGRRA